MEGWHEVGPHQTQWQRHIPYAERRPRKITNPRILGPGQWDLLHKIAARGCTSEGERFFLEFLDIFHDSLDCSTCKRHFGDYMYKFPISQYWDRKYGYLRWTHRCHNSVNAKLGKEEISFSVVKRWYGENWRHPGRRDEMVTYRSHQREHRMWNGRGNYLDGESCTGDFCLIPRGDVH